MKFLHTADWHLARLFHGVHLTEDQSFILDELLRVAKEARVGAVLIAGDIFDRAVPPSEAVELLDDVLSRLALDLHVAVIVIAGNHDSPLRVAFGSRLFSKQGVHVFGAPSSEVQFAEIADEHGPVRFYAVPYAEPAVVRERLGDAGAVDHESAMRCCIGAIRAGHGDGVRSVLLAHGFVAGGAECESERPLCVGGAGTIDAGAFEGFNYVALGHLHAPQDIGAAVHYSGSILKYSFSEAGQRKSVNIVEMDGAGRCSVERVALRPKHDVRIIRGMLAEIVAGPRDGRGREDYIHVVLEDKGALLDPMGRLREIYPNVLSIERPFLKAREEGEERRIDHKKSGDLELFRAFFQQTTGEAISAEEEAAFAGVADALRAEEREAVA